MDGEPPAAVAAQCHAEWGMCDGEPCQSQTARVFVETIYNPLQH